MENGTIQRIFEEMQNQETIDTKKQMFCVWIVPVSKYILMQQMHKNSMENKVSDIQKGAI